MTRVISSGGRIKVTPGFPIGAIVMFHAVAPVPDGWALCDGTLGTPDLTDRFLVGGNSLTSAAGGTTSPAAAFTHAGMDALAHSDHGVTQPAAHAAHTVTQPAAHSTHAATQPGAHDGHTAPEHTHGPHATAAQTAIGIASELSNPDEHSGADSAHAHGDHTAHIQAAANAHSAHTGFTVDAHSAHAGAAVNAHSAHSVTQAGAHTIWNQAVIAFIQRQN